MALSCRLMKRPMSHDMTFFRRSDAAAYVRRQWCIPCAPKTLAKLAVTGGGPPFRKAGRYPLYAPADLDDWAKSKIGPLQRSTSDVPRISAATTNTGEVGNQQDAGADA